jgi:DNA polymerase-3 subunit alpha
VSNWGSLHTHSRLSPLDGTTDVVRLVSRAVKLGYPFLGLSDHGNMAGTTQLYKQCKAEGILPYPGVELYLMDPESKLDYTEKKAEIGRYHLGVYARTTTGYQGLVQLVSMSHTRPRFKRYPRVTLADLVSFGENFGDDVILTTGCFFGWLQQALVQDMTITRAIGIAETYAQHFPHTFVEIQNHNIEHEGGLTDDDLVDRLVEIADELGLPILATQDSHYLNQSEKAAHSLMKKMVYSGADDGFPGDSFHLASSEWVEEHYPPEIWAKVEDSCKHLIDLNEVVIPALDKYTIKLPDMQDLVPPGQTSYEYLETICKGRMGNEDARYHDRLDYELSIIAQLGMADYFLHVSDYVEWCKAEGICVEARGSANASYVCYLLGITQVDPIKWGLLFERFLSTDRTKPPDIDIDIEDGRRAELLDYLDSQYRTTRIGTWGLLGSNDLGQGSILRTYQTYRARQATTDEERRLAYAQFQDLSDVEAAHKKDYEALSALDKLNVYRSYGVHAAGVLLDGDGFMVRDWIPTMLVASSDTTVTQFDMDACDEWGLLKDDILGQATLTVMRICQEYIGRDDPTDFTWIDDDDRAACALLREGRVDTGIFHFEGYTKSRGGKELGIKYTKDAVLAQALYMPGAMDTGQKDLYVERRRDAGKRQSVTYLHKAFEKALRPTYGAVIFQEQVIQIMRNLGMSIETINVFFKVVKDSGRGATVRNQERLLGVRREFNDHCLEAGISEDDLQEAWQQTAGFVAYGFNKAHATGYGIRAYRCAYLKAHYPLEFMAALLQVWSGRDKELIYVKEARRMRLRMLPPHVNSSGVHWTLDEKRRALRKGLLSIKGVGPGAAEDIIKNAPYSDVDDLINRCQGRSISGGKEYQKTGAITGRLLALHEAGALEGLL